MSFGSNGGSPVKYHHSHRFSTYSMGRRATLERAVTLLVPSGRPLASEEPGPRGAGLLRGIYKAGSDFPGRKIKRRGTTPHDPIRGQRQAGSLTGAVHLSNANAGVLRLAPAGQKPAKEQKGKSQLDLDFQYEYRPRKRGLSILLTLEFGSRGVRKVTTGITGLWRPSVHSDVAF